MLGGIFLWIQGIILVLVFILSIVKFIEYFGKKGPRALPFHRSHNAILFIGIFGLVWGIFTQLAGLVQALNAIIEAADVSPALIITGLRNSFINPVIGFSTLLVAALLWAILHARYTSVLKKGN